MKQYITTTIAVDPKTKDETQRLSADESGEFLEYIHSRLGEVEAVTDRRTETISVRFKPQYKALFDKVLGICKAKNVSFTHVYWLFFEEFVSELKRRK